MLRWVLPVLALSGACSGSPEPAADDGTGLDLSAGDPGDDADADAGDDADPDDQRFDVGPGDAPEPEPVVLADPPPPPISGGTLLLSHDGTRLYAADPDRDTIHVIYIATKSYLHAIDLAPGSEPGRLVEDPATGLLHVALRRAGEVATFDPASGELLALRPVCANPRGLAVDPADGSVLVACAEGILARLRPDDTVERLDVGVELRDIIDTDPVRVSTFREAEVLTLDDLGLIRRREAPPPVGVHFGLFIEPLAPGAEDPELVPHDVMVPNTARRTWGTAEGGWVMLHQAASTRELSAIMPGGYGSDDGSCIPLQATVVTHSPSEGAPPTAWPLEHIAPAFDVAFTPDLSLMAVVGGVDTDGSIMFVRPGLRPRTVVSDPCEEQGTLELPGEPTSVVFDGEGMAWVQLREPAALVVVDPETEELVDTMALDGESVRDSGHELFHRPTSGMVACVSCHPEGREDGRLWQFQGFGTRRTQSLDIGLAGSEPFHWRGELADLAAVVEETFERRMGGHPLHEEQVAALERWIFALEPLRVVPRHDAATIERGRGRFEAFGCASCHTGPRLTNDATMQMGWYGLLQVPSLLGVVARAPYLHDGRAADLETAVVIMLAITRPDVDASAEEIAEVVAYLESLGAA